jgi:hypothetical protein
MELSMVVLQNFAAETLRRKPSISAPNVTFNKAAEWDLYAKHL